MKKGCILLFLVLLISISGAVTTASDTATSITKTLSVSEGETTWLSSTDKGSFSLKGQKHTIDVKSVIENEVTLTIYSDPLTITLGVGERKEVDVDGNGFNDLFVRLDAISGDQAKLYFREVEEKIPVEKKVIQEALLQKITKDTAKKEFCEVAPSKNMKKFAIFIMVVLLIECAIGVYYVNKKEVKKKKVKKKKVKKERSDEEEGVFLKQ